MRKYLVLLLIILLTATFSSAVTSILISQLKSSSTTTGLIAITPPNSSSPIWGAPDNTTLVISPTGIISSPLPPTNKIFIETPAGTINGINPTFTLTHAPINFLEVIRNGLALFAGNGDFTISGTTITFATAQIPQSAPAAIDTLIALYQ
jgi:hypothetical protein